MSKDESILLSHSRQVYPKHKSMDRVQQHATKESFARLCAFHACDTGTNATVSEIYSSCVHGGLTLLKVQ